jgi:hypothetical protein
MFPRQQIGACEVIIFTGAFAASKDGYNERGLDKMRK